MSDAKGYGKLILFGEHFVVYKLPAVVAALADYTDCEIVPLNDGDVSGDRKWSMTDDRPAIPGYKVKKQDEQDEATALVLKHLGLLDKPMKITLGGPLVCTSGVGASAASCTAIARAASAAYALNLTDEQVNETAYEGEKGYHGTPSGIDNTASTYGGVLTFEKTDGAPKFAACEVAGSVEIVFASTGITASTTEVVGDVRRLREEKPEWFASLVDRYNNVLQKGLEALKNGDWAALGQMLNENHTILQELTVSCDELNDLVDTARAAGAIGAKMTGTGRGGLVLALTPGAEAQDAVFKALEGKAPHVWKTKIGV